MKIHIKGDPDTHNGPFSLTLNTWTIRLKTILQKSNPFEEISSQIGKLTEQRWVSATLS